MKRNKFASGNKDAKAKKTVEDVDKLNVSKLTGNTLVGPGHDLNGTLIPDSLIKKMNLYMPKNKNVK